MQCTWTSSYKTLKENENFRPFFYSRDENKNSKTLSQIYMYKTYPSISYSIICLLWGIKMKFMWQALYDRKRPSSIFIWPQGGDRRTGVTTIYPKPYCTSARHAQSYPKVSLTNVTEIKKCRFSTFIWSLGITWIFWNPFARIYDIPNHILEYHLFIFSNVDRVPVTTTSQKTTLIEPWGKNENFRNHCPSARHALYQILEYNLTMT